MYSVAAYFVGGLLLHEPLGFERTFLERIIRRLVYSGKSLNNSGVSEYCYVKSFTSSYVFVHLENFFSVSSRVDGSFDFPVGLEN